MTAAVESWWMGLSVDHLYERCPARQRSLPELRNVGWDSEKHTGLDPDGGDVCGWCLRVWHARTDRMEPA